MSISILVDLESERHGHVDLVLHYPRIINMLERHEFFHTTSKLALYIVGFTFSLGEKTKTKTLNERRRQVYDKTICKSRRDDIFAAIAVGCTIHCMCMQPMSCLPLDKCCKML